MTAFALKGLLGRKLRTALTAIAIVLGVAMISGTYVLTDSISSAFNAIFTQSYSGTDAVITGKSAFGLSSQGTTSEPSFDEALLAKVKSLPDVEAKAQAVGWVGQLIGRQATLLAYVDVFRYTAIATAVLVPLALLLRSPKPSPPEK